MLPFSIHAQDQTTFRSQSNTVLVPALVKDEFGNAVYQLEAKDFVIEDDGIEQAVHLDESAQPESTSIVLVLQTGRRAFREFARMRGLPAMLGPIFGPPDLRATDMQVALVEFDSKVRLVRDFTSDEGAIDESLKNLTAGDNGAAVLEAVDYAAKLLGKAPKGRQRVLLLISETRDHGSHGVNTDDVVKSIGIGDTVVYALPFSPSLSQVLDTERGSDKDEWRPTLQLLPPLLMAASAMKKNIPKTIAAMTGGEYELFASRKGFDTKMSDFTNHLESRHLLSFEPKDPHPGLHHIRVRLREPGKQTVLARSMYWAVAHQPR